MWVGMISLSIGGEERVIFFIVGKCCGILFVFVRILIFKLRELGSYGRVLSRKEIEFLIYYFCFCVGNRLWGRG